MEYLPSDWTASMISSISNVSSVNLVSFPYGELSGFTVVMLEMLEIYS